MGTVRDSGFEFNPDDTVKTALAKFAAAFKGAGIENADLDARFLLCGVLGCDPVGLIARPDRLVGEKASELTASLRRRLGGEPVSRILGVRSFYGRDFVISPAVLDPRPETETLIDAILDIADEMNWGGRSIRIADIGTGSGALIITALAELAGATGVASDVSSEALEVAQTNAARIGVADRLQFVHTRLLDGAAGPFDLIVANPPYIPSADIAGLDLSVRTFDPALALDGGPDGLDVYREIARDISRFEPTFWIVLEVGTGQAEAVAELFGDKTGGSGPRLVRFRNDLGGHTRCVALQIQR